MLDVVFVSRPIGLKFEKDAHADERRARHWKTMQRMQKNEIREHKEEDGKAPIVSVQVRSDVQSSSGEACCIRVQAVHMDELIAALDTQHLGYSTAVKPGMRVTHVNGIALEVRSTSFASSCFLSGRWSFWVELAPWSCSFFLCTSFTFVFMMEPPPPFGLLTPPYL